jgi:biopolymer transport protein ExbB/TolQ
LKSFLEAPNKCESRIEEIDMIYIIMATSLVTWVPLYIKVRGIRKQVKTLERFERRPEDGI